MIHLFNGFKNPYGGSEQETLALARGLSNNTDVKLWSTSSRASKKIIKDYGVKFVNPVFKSRRPDGGTYVFVGAHWRNKLWPYFIEKPGRLIYVYNTMHPKIIELTSAKPKFLGWPDVEYVCISELQRKMCEIEAVIHPSPIDIKKFVPPKKRRPGPPRVGRMSRDTIDKHHNEDPVVYNELASKGVQIILQGATCLGNEIPEHPNVKIFPTGAVPAAEFLQDLDVLFYRTGDSIETFGRVVFEAMACGKVVVCHKRGGYAEYLEDGVDSILFDDTDEAIKKILKVVSSVAEYEKISTNALKKVSEIYSKSEAEKRLEFYLS